MSTETLSDEIEASGGGAAGADAIAAPGSGSSAWRTGPSWPRRRVTLVARRTPAPAWVRQWVRRDLGPFLAVEEVGLLDAVDHLRRVPSDEIVLVDPQSPAMVDRLKGAFAMLPQRSRLLTRVPEGPRASELVAPALTWHGRLFKRTLDVLGSIALLLFLAPLMLLVALAIRLESRGPVFFVQPRYGLGCRMFDCVKFRSMRTDACDRDARQLTRRGDPRVTRVGAFIRRTSIDELPQLFNVLTGDMSLVGPRPHPVQARAGDRLYEEVVADFARRYRVPPGLTGLAQVAGLRGATDTEDKLVRRFELDLAYIASWSIWLDLAILARTPWASLKGDNAY